VLTEDVYIYLFSTHRACQNNISRALVWGGENFGIGTKKGLMAENVWWPLIH
jgi:hypothetical protein